MRHEAPAIVSAACHGGHGEPAEPNRAVGARGRRTIRPLLGDRWAVKNGIQITILAAARAPGHHVQHMSLQSAGTSSTKYWSKPRG
jgi:hypothetical protein